MSAELVLLALGTLMQMAMLPVVVFRRGRPTAGWVTTAAPFALAMGMLVAVLTETARPWPLPGVLFSVLPGEAVWTAAVVVLAALGSTALIWASVGTHRSVAALDVERDRARPALWHQRDDQPVRLVTWGPYALVRHPFYSAFLLALAAAVVAAPHPGTFAALAWGVVAMHMTARREERRLLASALGEDYAAYRQQTGQLLPRLRRGTAR